MAYYSDLAVESEDSTQQPGETVQEKVGAELNADVDKMVKELAEEEEKQQQEDLNQSVAEGDDNEATAAAQKKAEEEAARRREHEEKEALRKAEWEAKQAEKKVAEEKRLAEIAAMDQTTLEKESVQRLSLQTERLTHRILMEIVGEHVQTKCFESPDFARLTLHPRKSMSNCYRYILRNAREYTQKVMEERGIKQGPMGYGCDVPDGIIQEWAEEYFYDSDAPEDGEKEEFKPEPYRGGGYVPKKKAEKKPKVNKEKKAASKKTEVEDGQISMSLPAAS